MNAQLAEAQEHVVLFSNLNGGTLSIHFWDTSMCVSDQQ